MIANACKVKAETHAIHTLYTHCTLIVHTLYTHCTHTVHTLYTHCAHIVHTLYIHKRTQTHTHNHYVIVLTQDEYDIFVIT